MSQVETHSWPFHIRVEEDFDEKVNDVDKFTFFMRKQLSEVFETTQWNIVNLEVDEGSIIITGSLAAYNKDEEDQLGPNFANVDEKFRKGNVDLVGLPGQCSFLCSRNGI